MSLDVNVVVMSPLARFNAWGLKWLTRKKTKRFDRRSTEGADASTSRAAVATLCEVFDITFEAVSSSNNKSSSAAPAIICCLGAWPVGRRTDSNLRRRFAAVTAWSTPLSAAQ